MFSETWIRGSYAGSFPRNSWFNLPGLNVYLRVVPGLKRIDIANVTAEPQGRGTFTRFLEKMEALAEELGAALFIENVLEERFQQFFENRGYESNGQDPPCFTRVRKVLKVKAGGATIRYSGSRQVRLDAALTDALNYLGQEKAIKLTEVINQAIDHYGPRRKACARFMRFACEMTGMQGVPATAFIKQALIERKEVERHAALARTSS